MQQVAVYRSSQEQQGLQKTQGGSLCLQQKWDAVRPRQLLFIAMQGSRSRTARVQAYTMKSRCRCLNMH